MANLGQEADIERHLRLDKWLFYERFLKTRALASTACKSGKIRLNGETINKAHISIRVGDVVTFKQGKRLRAVKVQKLAERRGPAPEAQALYEEIASLS